MKIKAINNISDLKIIKFVIIIFLIWYLILQIIAGQNIIKERQSNDLPLYATTYWGKWDAQHYLDIAINGYKELKTVFFPLYPLMVRLFYYLGLNPYWSGHILSSLFLLIALYFFIKLVIIDFSLQTAKWSIIFLLLYPSSFFLISIYPTSLLLLLTITSLYLARKSKWLLASLLALLASLTKFSGIILLPVLLVEYLEQINFEWKKIKKNILLPFMSLLGTAIYSLFLYFNFNNAFLFLTNQYKWKSYMGLPHSTFHNYIIYIINATKEFKYTQAISLFMVFLCLLVVLAVVTQKIKRIRLSYLLLTAGIVLYPFFGVLLSFNRFILAAFPVFIMMALIKNKRIKYLLIIFLSVFLIINVTLFTNSFWTG